MKLGKLEYRMYGWVPYNISPIQQGIQFQHAVQEFNNIATGWQVVPRPFDYETRGYLKKWATLDKTSIILNGGTTNLNPNRLGSLNQVLETLETVHELDCASFYEEDLGDQLTAVVTLLDERVWDFETYPSPPKELLIPNSDGSYPNISYYVDKMGGKKIWELRQFVMLFKLA